TGETPSFRLTVEGSQRPLHVLVSEEVLRIAEEAIRNAIQHAGAKTIEAALTHGRQYLRLAIRDDGAGISETILKAGRREGHYGLVGMRERAEQIGGRLALTSRPAAGTVLTLVVPARTAYRHDRVRLLDRLRGMIARR
ncbi:MAG TPA: ATP-binding protein, partial [Rhizomicrobium sp.]